MDANRNLAWRGVEASGTSVANDAAAALMIDDGGQEALCAVMRAVTREYDADGVLVTWHDPDNSPMFLFGEGAYVAGENVDAMLVQAASYAASMTDGSGRLHWSSVSGADEDATLTSSIPADGGVVTITTRFRRMTNATRARANEAAVRLLPLVKPFFRLWSNRLRSMARLRGLTAAVNHTDIGIALIDRGGHLMFLNAAAEALIAQNDGLRRSGSMLTASMLSDTLRLQAAVEHVINVNVDPALAPISSPVIALNRRVGRPLMAAVVGSDAPVTSGSECAAIVYIFDPENNLQPLIDPVCKLYGLSPAETRLAVLLADGRSLAEAAGKLRIRDQTARSCLKHIFQKTGTNRQAELVCLLLRSSVRGTGGDRPSLM